MAPRRPRTRRTRRKYYKRKSKRISNMWPATKVVKFRIALSKETGTTGGAINVIAFKMNSLNDPTSTESAQLPLGLDQWSALYTKYKVLGSRIKVLAHPTTITGAGMIGLHLATTATPLTDHDHYRELPNTSMKMVSPDIDLAQLQINYSIHKYPFHIRNVKDADDQEGTFSTSPGDPADICYCHFFTQDSNKTSTVTFDYQLVQEFVVLLYDRTMPSRSAL